MYRLFMYSVKYKVPPDRKVLEKDWSEKEAEYNVSAPSQGVADEEVARVFHGKKDMTYRCQNIHLVHCAIQLVRWGLGQED